MIAKTKRNTFEDAGSPEFSEIRYKIAGNYEQRSAAFNLVYRNYLRKGLIDQNEQQLRVTPYHLLATTNTFIAEYRGDVICTVSLIGDGELGLPMESIYGDAVMGARRQGLYVGEVSCLALEDMPFKCFLPIFVKLTRLMAQHCRTYGMDQFLIVIHPKHAKFYQRFMGFERIGALTTYPTVRDAPAVACCLDFARIDRERPACYDQFFGTPLPRAELRMRPMSEMEIEAFGWAAESTTDCVTVVV
jgi:hypothetical protein